MPEKVFLVKSMNAGGTVSTAAGTGSWVLPVGLIAVMGIYKAALRCY